MNLSAQKGAIAPLLVIILLIIGIFVGTKLVDVPQLLKSRAAEKLAITNIECGGIEGKTCPRGHSCVLDGDFPDAAGKCIPNPSAGEVSTSCDGYGELSLVWQPVPEAANYTVRINHYPDTWAPDYTEYDVTRLTKTFGEFHGDRAFEAGNTTNTSVNVGYGYFVGGTITASDGTIQVIPSFTCNPKKQVYCAQVLTTACAPGSQVNCKQFPTPCDVPSDWTEVAVNRTDKRCAQIVTRACQKENPSSCQEFPTPCDVPSGWVSQ